MSTSQTWLSKNLEREKAAPSRHTFGRRDPFSTFLTLGNMSTFAPPVHRGMLVLNREAFKKSFETLGVRMPAKKVGAAMKILSK